MWHRVAALLGRTVEEIQQQMSSAEFSDWCDYYTLEPWGWEALNWRMGVLSATVANYSGHAKRPLKPSDFMPGAPKRPTMSKGELRARLAADVEKAKRNGD